MRCLFSPVAVVIVHLALLPGSAPAQLPLADTTAVRLVAGPSIEHLHSHLVRALLQRELQPWSVTIPDSASVAWLDFADKVHTMLRSRPVAPSDSVSWHFSVRPPRLRGDSLLIVLAVEERHPCRNMRGIYFMTRAYWWIRRDRRWVPLESEPPMHAAGRCEVEDDAGEVERGGAAPPSLLRQPTPAATLSSSTSPATETTGGPAATATRPSPIPAGKLSTSLRTFYGVALTRNREVTS